MKNFQSKKAALAKRIKLSDGYRTAMVYENDLVEIRAFIRFHAKGSLNNQSNQS